MQFAKIALLFGYNIERISKINDRSFLFIGRYVVAASEMLQQKAIDIMTYAYFLGIEFRIGQRAVADAETYLFAGIVTSQSESDFSVCRVFLRISQSADQCLNEPSGIGCDGLRLLCVPCFSADKSEC